MNKGRIPVSGVFTGICFTIVGFICFLSVYYPFLLTERQIFYQKIRLVVIVILILFLIGCFIPSLHNAGFMYYKQVRLNWIAKREKAKKEKGKELKRHGKFQNFMFKTFRDGSVAEECSDSMRKLKSGESSFIFLDGCKNEQEAVNKHRALAREIMTNTTLKDSYYVNKTYRDCEKFQCLDIGFKLFAVLIIFLGPLNIVFNHFKNYNFSIVMPFVYGALFYAIHKICKHQSKNLAQRYLSDINTGWQQIEETKKEREANMLKKVGNTYNIDRIITKDNSITILGDNTGNIFNKYSIIDIKQELRKGGISEKQIENIELQIANIATELSKDKLDENKLRDIFTEIKKRGGNSVVSVFKFLGSSVIDGIIQNLINRTM